MRVPTVSMSCMITAAAAVVLMTVGTVYESPEVRAWALLVGMFAATLGVCVAIRRGTEAVKAYVHRWSLETFEHGYKQGVIQGREMAAAEHLMSSLRDN